MPIVPIEHIEVDDRGVAKLVGHRIKVVHLIGAHLANGWGPDELHEQFPHLTLGQIYAAFSYYHDHKAQIDEQIENGRREAERLRAADENNPLRLKLRALGKIP